jgi:asparagine synthetase B (glutamine-hydrolysing)
MPGIAGLFNLNYNKYDAFRILGLMCDAIIHRAPADNG